MENIVLKNKGTSKNIVRAKIEDYVFVRVTNIDSLNETININIYMQLNGTDGSAKYKLVAPQELPVSIVNKLTLDNSYEKMSEIEIVGFLNTLKKLQGQVYESNKFEEAEFLEINSVCDVTYLFAKGEKEKFYALNRLIINEFSVAHTLDVVSPYELPYVVMDIVDRFKLKEFTAIVMINHFVRVVKRDDKYICIVYQFVPDETGASKNSVKVLDIYTIAETDKDFVLIKDEESDLFYPMNEEILKDITSDFLDTIGLSMTNN